MISAFYLHQVVILVRYLRRGEKMVSITGSWSKLLRSSYTYTQHTHTTQHIYTRHIQHTYTARTAMQQHKIYKRRRTRACRWYWSWWSPCCSRDHCSRLCSRLSSWRRYRKEGSSVAPSPTRSRTSRACLQQGRARTRSSEAQAASHLGP